MSNKPTLTQMDLVADMLHQIECNELRKIGPRWMCLREDLREKWLAKAESTYQAWAKQEREAEDRRAAGSPRAFFGDST